MGTLTVTSNANPYRHLVSSLLPSKPYHFFLSKPRPSSRVFSVRVRAYIERNPNSFGSIASKVIGSLPVLGLYPFWVSSPESSTTKLGSAAMSSISPSFVGGLETSVGFRILGLSSSFKIDEERLEIYYMFFYAVGAGLLKSEEILEAVARLQFSNDIEFEEESCLSMMTAAKEKRAKLKAAIPEISYGGSSGETLEAIYVCCFGRDLIEEEDVRLLCIMLNAVFPSVGKSEIERIVTAMAKQVTDGERTNYPEPKTLSKEAVQRQMKDLQFLKQNSDYSS